MRDRARFRLPVLLALAALLAACGDSTTSPPVEPRGMRIVAVAGDGQQGFTGRLLPLPLTVRVETAEGGAAAGVRVRFAVAEGGGSVEGVSGTTDPAGEARASWRLGRSGAQTLTVTVEGDDGVRAATFRALAFAPSQADVVVVRGAGGAGARVVLFNGSLAEGHSLAPGDSVLLLPPREGGTAMDEVMVLAPGRRPALISPLRWSAGRDSAEAWLAPALRIPLAIWIVEGPFEQQAAVARAHLAAAREVFGAAVGLGVELGDVEVLDATGYTGSRDMVCETSTTASIGSAPGRINVYYVRNMGPYSGYACSAGVVLMARHSGGFAYLLAHELGHSLGLLHTAMAGNVMVPELPGPGVTTAQVFWANFSSESALFQVYHAVPEPLVRSCWRITPNTRRCIPATYHFP